MMSHKSRLVIDALDTNLSLEVLPSAAPTDKGKRLDTHKKQENANQTKCGERTRTYNIFPFTGSCNIFNNNLKGYNINL